VNKDNPTNEYQAGDKNIAYEESIMDEIQTKQVVQEVPDEYSQKENPIVSEPPKGNSDDTRLVTAEPGKDPSRYKSKSAEVVPAVKSKDELPDSKIGAVEGPNGFTPTTQRVRSAGGKNYSAPPTKVVNSSIKGWVNPGYEAYTEGESSVTGIPRAEAKIVMPSEDLKSEFYQYLGGYLRGNTNLDNYGGSFLGVMDQLSSNFNGTALRGIAIEGDRIYNSFNDLLDAWKKGGFKGAVANLLHQLNQNTATPIQSDAIVPAINRLIDSIPIVSMFTKQKYSLDLNKKTYAHEEVYNKAINYQASALKIYEGGMYGLYWYAKFYANHDIPLEIQPMILGRLAGDPKYSRPTPEIFNSSVREYVSVIADAYDTAKAAEHVNLYDFTTTDMVEPFKKVFNDTKLNIQGKTARSNFNDDGTPKNVEIRKLDFKKSTYKLAKLGTEHPAGAVIRFDQISPKFNTHLGKYKVATKVTKRLPPQSHLTDSKRDKTMFRGWSEYVINTMGGKTTTTSGAVYVDPREWNEINVLESGVKINSVADYETYRDFLYGDSNNPSGNISQLDQQINKVMKYGDIYYGYYPYKWSQVFENFEISSNGNWNVALSEFTGNLSRWSMFVPKNRPTYGTWCYMPIISYEFMDKDLNSTSVPVSESLNLQIPSSINFVSTLQLTFVDDRYDRIFNWFAAYVNSIYGQYDNYVKPYKNCCLRAVIDILDWDRTILKRMKYAIVPSHYTQQYVGEQDHSYKTVSVTFSVVAEIPETNWKPQ